MRRALTCEHQPGQAPYFAFASLTFRGALPVLRGFFASQSSSTTATAHRLHEVIAIRRSPRGVRPRSPRGVGLKLGVFEILHPAQDGGDPNQRFRLAKRIAQANAPFFGYGGAEGDLFPIRRIF